MRRRTHSATTRRCATSAGLHAIILCAAVVLSSACHAGAATPPPPDPDPERARAALATLYVTNRTVARLDVAYRHASQAAGEVGIGGVDAGATAEMAPVPAGEPIILVARTSARAALTLPPRTFPIDSAWTWVIERASRFTPPDTGAR